MQRGARRGGADHRRGAQDRASRWSTGCARRPRPSGSAGSRRRAREIAAETARALEQIRAEVADLTLEATSIVVGRKLDSDRDRELIAEAIGSLDFSRLEESA